MAGKIKIMWLIKAFLIAVGVVGVIILVCYLTVDFNASGRTFDKVEEVPAHEYGLLLGTSPYNQYGQPNHYFRNRIDKAVELYKAGKVKKIIASGADYTHERNYPYNLQGYDEPLAMRDSLVKKGVRSEDIILDRDGYRTLKSIENLKNIYHVDSCVLISQQYHNERAIYQADKLGVKAVGFNAAPTHIRRLRLKNQIRELFARVKLFIDMAGYK